MKIPSDSDKKANNNDNNSNSSNNYAQCVDKRKCAVKKLV